MRGRVQSLNDESIVELQLVNVEGSGSFAFPLSDPGPSTSIRARPTTRDPSRTHCPRRSGRHLVFACGAAIGAHGPRDVELTTSKHESVITDSTLISLRSSHRRAVVLEISPPTVEVDAARVDGDALEVSGHVPGVRSGTVTLNLASVKARSHPSTATIEDGEFSMLLFLRHREPKFGDAVLPVRRYVLEYTVTGPGGPTSTGRARASSELTSALPVPIDGDRVALTLARGAGRSLTATIVPPIGRQARGAYNRNRLQLEHRAAVASDEEQELEGLLIDSYFGEVASCNGIGVQQELRRRGTAMPIYWTVQDYSVGLPEGGIPVVLYSMEWYKCLRTAKYLLTNMYQPAYHPKPPGQTIIQTFHGYPFKLMGHPHWASLRMSRQQLESFDQRTREWDYLVSPARYATPLLTRAFAYDGNVLEIGYPRNDALLAAGGHAIPASVRERSGHCRGGQGHPLRTHVPGLLVQGRPHRSHDRPVGHRRVDVCTR